MQGNKEPIKKYNYKLPINLKIDWMIIVGIIMIILGFNFDEGEIDTIGYIGLTACLLWTICSFKRLVRIRIVGFWIAVFWIGVWLIITIEAIRQYIQ